MGSPRACPRVDGPGAAGRVRARPGRAPARADLTADPPEDSGPSDRAFGLAVLVEHISAWSDAGLSADAFLGSFGLTAAEQVRVREYRCLSALFWLMMLPPGSPAHDRNPPGTLERQATRLLLLLEPMA